jgi:long-chain acyl-CoA synthetase
MGQEHVLLILAHPANAGAREVRYMAEYGFWKVAERAPTRLALAEAQGRELTFGELAAQANRLTHALRALGLQPGDAVATCLPNCVEMIEAYLAAFQAGFYLVPINHHLVATEIAYILSDCEAKAFIGHERFADVCRAAADEAGIPAGGRLGVGGISGFTRLDQATAEASPELPLARTAGQVMNYTSGTTGRPKGVRRALPPIDPDTMGSLYALFLSMFAIEPESDNVHLCGSPLYHTAVLLFTGCSLHFGHGVVLLDKWTPESCLAAIERYRVTTSHMVPTQFHRLLALSDDVKRRYDLSSLRAMIHAAAPCPVDIKRRMLEWWGPTIWEYYAASEGGGTVVSPQEWLRFPGTVGKPWPTSDIKIYDDDGNEMAPNRPGTVYMLLGSNDFKYHKDDKKTAANRRGSYFTVGDIGYLNDDGYLFLCDRKADMIISGGVNIYPAEIESVLLMHPRIADAAVFGIPHEDWGEEVKAVVELADGVKPGNGVAEDILAFCEDKLAKYKRPKSIDFIETMPRDPNGKLYKRKLRDPYWAGRDRAI